MALAFVFTANRWNDGVHHDHESRPIAASVSHVLRQPLVWLQIALFFFMTGIEACAGAWSYTILFEKFDMEKGEAGLWAGFYWGAIAAGRLVLAPLSRNLGPAKLIQFGTFGLVIGGLLMTSGQQLLYQSGLVLFGLAMAPLFPTLMSLTPARLGSNVSLHSIGFQVSAAVLGGAAIPTFAGIMAGRTNLSAIPWTIVTGAVIVVALETVLRARADGQVPATADVQGAAYPE
jgi:fucose permease